jgi:K+-sensing histidine kinase KdpD
MLLPPSHDRRRPQGSSLRRFASTAASLAVFAATGVLAGRRTQRTQAQQDADGGRRAAIVRATAGLRALDADGIHTEIVTALQGLGYNHASVSILSGDGTRAVVASSHPHLVHHGDVPEAGGIGGIVIAQDRTVLTHDYRLAEERLPGREHARGMVSAPIRRFGTAVGVVHAGHPTPGFDALDIDAVEAMALHAGVALEKAVVYEREQALVQRLREVEQMRDDLLSNVSHELRTPLQAILGMGETLVTHWDELTDERALELVERSNANAERLHRRIETLMTHARFQAGASSPELAPVELVAFLDRLLERLGPVLAGREVRRDALGAPQHVLADAALLEHVVENLLVNALQHTAAGSPITLEMEGTGGGVGLAVLDEGDGLSEDDLRRVTERFYRGGHPDRREASGLGLGLSLVAAILEAHGAALEVANRPVGGARFGFVLPSAPAPDEPGTG